MIRFRCSSKGRAAHYFSEATKIESYYTGGQDMAGKWYGRGARRLGLSGDFKPEVFAMLCDNINPATGEKLTVRMAANRRDSYEISFNCPKSVSLAWEWLNDPAILAAVRRATLETMRELERKAATRVRKGGANENRITGELAWVEFIHFTARPENGLPDPHLHIHCVMPNATFDKVENQWKAVELGDIWRTGEYYQAVFHMRLAEYLKEAGYGIVRHGKWFEIEGISRSLIKKFSRRGERVMAEAKRRGITTAKGRDILAGLTREGKIKEMTKSELHARWWPQLTVDEICELNSLARALTRSQADEPVIRASQRLGKGQAKAKAGVPTEFDKEAVAYALEHVFERKSVVTELELTTEAINWGVGQATLDGIKKVVKELPLLRAMHNDQELVTTSEVFTEEKRIVARCLEGKNTLPSINPSWRIQDERLNDEHRNAVRLVLCSTDFIVGICGKAGTGKTTLLHEAKRGIEAGGHKLLVLAPMAQTAHDVLRKQGFENAETVAQLLVNPRLQEEARGAVLWVDEAGLLSARQADRLLELADNLGARVVLVGDTGQHHAVERGQAFDLLRKYGKMSVVSVEEIQRQKGFYKEVVELIAAQQYETAFNLMMKHGMIVEMPLEQRDKYLAKDYIATLDKGKTALVISPTHFEGEGVTQAIRDAMKDKGILKGGKEYEILRNLSWTAAQKRDPRHYEPGLVVKMAQNAEGFDRDEQMEVVEADGKKVRVRGANGETKELPLSQPQKFCVFERDAIEICEGDRIRITANGRSAENQRLTNGSFYKNDYISHDGKIVLDNGWRLDNRFSSIQHGYSSTSHGCQGTTVDFAYIAQSAMSAGASDAQQFYVSISRGREGAKAVTDDLELLRELFAKQRDRKMAMEIMQPESKKFLGQQGPGMNREMAESLRENVEQVRKRRRVMTMAM